MKIFLRTLIITLILCVGYYFYVSLNETSYNKIVRVPNEIAQKAPVSTKAEEPQRSKNIKICLLNNSGTCTFVKREADKVGIQNAIELLLVGANSNEKKQGLYSEIPNGTRLYWVREEKGNLIVNLNDVFAQGGGTSSVMARIDQLVKTVKIYNPDAPVYLYLEGKKVEYIGGDGVFLQQPLN